MRAISCAALLLAACAVAAPPPKAKPADGGLFVLDDCDPVFRGKVAYEDNLSWYDSSGKLQFRVGGLNVAGGIGCNRRVAVDRARKAVWVHDEVARRVRKFDFAGKEVLALEGLYLNALAVDPDTGNLWVATSKGEIYGHKTVVYSAAGKRLAEHDAGGWDIAYDARGKAFWLAGKDLYKVSAKLPSPGTLPEVVVRRGVAGWCTACVTVNQKTGQVWVVSREYQRGHGRNELLGFDNEGKPTVTVPLGDGEPTRYPYHASVDAKTGSVWVTIFKHEVRRYTAAGKPDGAFKFRALAAEADGVGGAWVVTAEEVLRVGGKGEVLRRSKHLRPTEQVWVAAY